MAETLDRSPEEILARAGWPAVQTALLRGIAHDLAGRAAALGGLTELLRLEDERDPSPLDLLAEESRRLVEAVELLRLLAEEHGAEPEALAPGGLVAEVLRLHGRHRGLETVETALEVEEGIPPVRARRGPLVRVLLLLLGAVGWETVRAGARRIEVRLRAEGDRVVVALGRPDAHPPAEDGEEEVPAPQPEAAVRAAGAVLADEGGTVRRLREEGPGAWIELSLPAIARREERE